MISIEYISAYSLIVRIMDEIWTQRAADLSEKLKKNMDRGAMQDIMQEAKEFLGAGNYEGMQHYFSEVYELIYHDMIFKKMIVNNATRVLLETLALPTADSAGRKALIALVDG